MRRYEEREVRQPTVVQRTLVEVKCDRCGRDALVRNAPIRRRGWAFVDILLQGGGEQKADLCRACAESLAQWIQEGP